MTGCSGTQNEAKPSSSAFLATKAGSAEASVANRNTPIFMVFPSFCCLTIFVRFSDKMYYAIAVIFFYALRFTPSLGCESVALPATIRREYAPAPFPPKPPLQAPAEPSVGSPGTELTVQRL